MEVQEDIRSRSFFNLSNPKGIHWNCVISSKKELKQEEKEFLGKKKKERLKTKEQDVVACGVWAC